MITVIDMTTGRLIYRSSEYLTADESKEYQVEKVCRPELALQEVCSEREELQMPPELAGCEIDHFLTKFD